MKDSLEKFLRAIGGLIEDDASIKEILGQIAEHYKNSTELELDFEDVVVKIDTEMSAGYAKKVPFVVALIENSKAFLESQGEDISENEKRILRRVIRLSRIEDSSIRIQYLDKEAIDVGKKMELQINRMKSQDEVIKNLKEEINSITNQTNTIKGQIDNTKRDFVAILGIFAAIFMAFDSGLKINLAIFDKKGLDGLIALCLFMFASFFTLILLHSLYRFVKDIANSNQNFNKTNSKELRSPLFCLS
ncbi:hypothetical protein [Helicobacter pylori]|uniref:hypothetical protein n=1 Tax=Helicobacter pylori TaxID=210 RepID=UPI001F0C2993|nr:hypothetical protein [Helicobacter pylori]